VFGPGPVHSKGEKWLFLRHKSSNLGALSGSDPAAVTQSYVQVSFEAPEYTADTVGLGALRILEALRNLGLEKKTRFYQASTSELYGLVQETPQTEKTPFYPRSPYACAKLYVYRGQTPRI